MKVIINAKDAAEMGEASGLGDVRSSELYGMANEALLQSGRITEALQLVANKVKNSKELSIASYYAGRIYARDLASKQEALTPNKAFWAAVDAINLFLSK